jgi:transposase
MLPFRRGRNTAQSQRRLRPAKYGKWNSIYKRLTGWCEQGVWERMLEYFADLCCRSHKKTVGRPEQALGRSCGGSSTQIHITVDGVSAAVAPDGRVTP